MIKFNNFLTIEILFPEEERWQRFRYPAKKVTKKAFDMGTFKDTFVEQLKKKIEQSKKGKKVKEIEDTTLV